MIGVVNYEAGNLRSVLNALTLAGIDYKIGNRPDELATCLGIILPGVGAAPGAMKSLRDHGLTEFLPALQVPFLGICLGMQILFEHSEEGNTKCLGIIPGTVDHFPPGKVKIPHMGWNEVERVVQSPLWDGIGQKAFFYFAHSFVVGVNGYTVAETSSGVAFSAAVRLQNFYGVQFHPEKSSHAGIQLLKNFDMICRSYRQ